MEPTSTIPDLASHSEFLRRLARRLIRDEHAAEDAVQDALVAAIRKPPPFTGAPRAWLSAVVKNLARMGARERGRRQRRETAVARSEWTASTADAVASIEIARRVVTEVSALDEPYRTVLVLRYYHDLRFAEIADRLDCPVATVRTRHHRALALLRDRMDEQSRGNRRAWVMALLPLVEGVAMKKSAVAILLVLFLLLFVGLPLLLLLGSGGPRPAPSKLGEEAAIVAADPAAAGPADERVEAPRPASDDADPPDDVAVVRVVDGAGRVVSGARVSLLEGPFDLDNYVPPRIVAEGTTDDRGRARFDVAPFTRYAVKIVHPDYAVTGDLNCWGGNLVDLPVRRAGAVHGEVHDADTGLPVAGATVWVMDWCGAGVLHEWTTRTDREGRYRVDGIGKGMVNLCAWADGYVDAYPSRPFVVRPSADARCDLVLTAGRPLVLRFIDADTHLPVPEVTVRYGPHAPITGPGTGFPTLPVSPTWHGSFVVKARGYADRVLEVPVEQLQRPETRVEVRLSRGVAVSGRVLRESGEPAPGVKVRLWSDEPTRTQWIILETKTDGDGTFARQFAIPGGRVRWEVFPPGGGVRSADWMPVPDPSGEIRLPPVTLVETVVVRGRVLDPEGAPVSGAIVRLPAPVAAHAPPRAETHLDPRGRFRLLGVPRGPCELLLTGVDDYPNQVRSAVAGDGEEVVWRLPRGQEITGRVLDSAGRPCPREWVKAEPGNAMSRTDEGGRFRFRGLSPGTYRLTLSNYRDAPTHEVRGNTYDVVLRLPVD